MQAFDLQGHPTHVRPPLTGGQHGITRLALVDALGADLLNLPKVGRLGAPAVSIGGAGTFDGVFLTGLIAVLLAGLL